MKVSDLKVGDCVNHPTKGYSVFTGLATRHPYTDEIRLPKTYCFTLPVDDNGDEQPDYSTQNGDLEVEFVEHSDWYDDDDWSEAKKEYENLFQNR